MPSLLRLLGSVGLLLSVVLATASPSPAGERAALQPGGGAQGGGRHDQHVAAQDAAPPPLPPASSAPFPPSMPPGSINASVPKLIWMFWDDDKPPELIAACIAQIVRMNPGWLVTLIKPGDFLELTGTAEPLPVEYLDLPHAADWFRISALALHGGVWMDASIATLKPVESFVDLHSEAQVQGFAMPGQEVGSDMTMENWFIAAPYPSPFVTQWRDNFKQALLMGPQEYCNSLSDGVLGSLGRSMLPYLTQHAAWRHARHQLPTAPVRVVPSDDERGPLSFLANVYHGDSVTMMGTSPQGIFNLDEATWNAKYDKVVFVKFRGAERLYIQPLANYHGYLATTLQSALSDTYVGGEYIEMNPYSIWWWIRLSVASAVGLSCLACCLAAGITYCVMKRRMAAKDAPLLAEKPRP